MRPVWYTDGACSGNGNPDARGGWGAICIDEDSNSIVAFGANQTIGTTNNRMEMEAIIYAVEHRISGYPLIIKSDSAYAVNTFNNWMYNWQRNGWIKSDKKTPENLDLVKKYFELTREIAVVLEKVKGHQDDYWNNYVDKIATGRLSIEQIKKELNR